MPEAMALEQTSGADLSTDEIKRRADQIRDNRDFNTRVGQALANRYEDDEPSPYVEKKIYDGFPSKSDEVIMSRFQGADWPERLELGKQLSDARLRDLARRQIYFEKPELLSNAVRRELDEWLSERFLTEDPDVPWRTIPRALEEVKDLLKTTEGEEHKLMVAVKEYILELAKEHSAR
jgi:exonuclease I